MDALKPKVCPIYSKLCMQKYCQWWEEENQCCIVETLARNIAAALQNNQKGVQA